VTWTARRATRLAIVAAGYGDGYPRPAGASDAVKGADALFGGRRCPVVGRVSMDLLAVDITDAADLHPRRGDYITLLGAGIEIDQFAQWSRTISYDVLTRLGHRYHRIWKS
jgi:alanine racemase